MKKFGKYFICLLIIFGLFSIVSYADMNLEVEYVSKYDDVYDVDVLINENFNLTKLVESDITLPDDFRMFNTCEGLDGSILSDCNETAEKTIGYIHPEELPYSEENVELQEIPGEIVLIFRDAGTLKDETYVDVVVTINNIKIKRNREDIISNKPAIILRQGPEYMSTEANSIRSGFSVSYDIAFELKKDGSIVENKTMGIVFRDIDVYNANYPESIKLLSGVKDNKVYRLTGSENYLCINETNTEFTTAKVCGLTTEEKWNFTEEEEKLKGGFALKVDSSSFKYNWTGSGCGTDISFLTVNDLPDEPVPDTPVPDVPDDNPKTGTVSTVIIVFVLLVVSGLVMFVFFRKNNEVN